MHLRRLQYAIVLVCIALPACRSAGIVTTGHSEHRFETSISMGYDYLLHLPASYEDQSEWPLMLFLHGAGERGQDLELVKTHGPPRIVESQPDFPFVLVSPQVPEGERWDSRILNALLDDVVDRYSIDTDRIVVTGLSMGGFGTWDLGVSNPSRFAALVPICGGGAAWRAGRLRDVPVWVFHGAKDEVVPLEASEEMVQALQRAGGNVRLTVYPDAGHDSWTETYDNPEVYEWLLDQRRGVEVPRP